MKYKTLISAAFTISFYLVLNPAYSQSNSSSDMTTDPLFQTVKALDTKLFDAYNNCDLETMKAMVAEDLEFYHDQTGLSVGREPFLTSIKQYICGKVSRKLLADTLEVYPLKNYGAVEIGVHRFGHPGHPENPESDAKFVMLWQHKGDTWILTRVISYEHNHGLLAK